MADPDAAAAAPPDRDKLISQMTLEEKVGFCSGASNWYAAGLPRLGIPEMKMTDGPSGARGEGARSINFAGHRSACFPCGTALGATWDPALVTAIGAAIGEEVVYKGAHLLLGPTVNLHRSPLGGRHFECFSEDPHLTGVLGAAFVRGAQSRGVGATAKHLVCNESEFQRHTLSSVVDERTLHEVYLRPFQMIVAHAAPMAIMTAYNRINGVAASDHRRIISDIVKDEWGFEGLVVSDWGGTRSTVDAANAGLDLEMPGPAKWFGARLLDAVLHGEVDEEVIDDKVRRQLRTLERIGAWERPSTPEQTIDDPIHRRVARQAAAASMVLLQNPQGLLPLDLTHQQVVAVIGPNADRAAIQGGGSSQVAPHAARSPLEAITAAVGDGVELIHEPGCRIDRRVPDLELRLVRPPGTDPDEAGSVRVESRQGTPGSGSLVGRTERRSRFLWQDLHGGQDTELDARISATFRADATGTWTFRLAVAGRARLLLDGEPIINASTGMARGAEFFEDSFDDATSTVDLVAGHDHDLVVEFWAPEAPGLSGVSIGAFAPQAPDLMSRAVRAAAAADAVVLVVGLNDDWETEGRDRDSLELPGDQAELIRRVTGANLNTIVVVNAGAPTDLSAVPESAALLYIWYPGEEGADALTDVVFGELPPGGRLPTTFPRSLADTPSHGNYPGELGEVLYGEGLLVGHRWYDSRRIEPAFPFGFGLSTTTVQWADIVATGSIRHNNLEIALTVSNTGPRPGSEVVQVYAHFLDPSVSRPHQQLVAFAKVYLDAGETASIAIPVDAATLMYRNPANNTWELDPGTVELRIGQHSRHVESIITVTG